jgi:hypothetical protein
MNSTTPRPWWLGIAVILIGAICLYASSQLNLSAQYAAIGPGLFVALVGVGLVGLGVLLLVQIGRGTAFDNEELAADPGMDKLAFFTVLLAALIPALVIEALGLPLTAMVSFMLVARALGSRRTIADLVAGFILGSVAWYLFSRLGLQLGHFFPLLGA